MNINQATLPFIHSSPTKTQSAPIPTRIASMSNMDEKQLPAPIVVHDESRHDHEKKDGVLRDYSGAILEIDPAEKRLVKKLDWRIMVSNPSQTSLDKFQ